MIINTSPCWGWPRQRLQTPCGIFDEHEPVRAQPERVDRRMMETHQGQCSCRLRLVQQLATLARANGITEALDSVSCRPVHTRAL